MTTDPYIHQLASLLIQQILAGETCDYDRHGFMVVMESSDTVEQLAQEVGAGVNSLGIMNTPMTKVVLTRQPVAENILVFANVNWSPEWQH